MSLGVEVVLSVLVSLSCEISSIYYFGGQVLRGQVKVSWT